MLAGDTGVGTLTFAVTASPFVVHDVGKRVRRILEGIVFGIEFARFDLSDLSADFDHRVDKSVEFGLRFAFCRLDHQRACNRERHSRGVEAKIH